MLGFIDLESRVPPEHPLRTIKALADQALAALSPEFDRMYAEAGRPSIPPERLLKASVLIALYSVRSERAFCEELDYHLLFRWFLDMNLIEPSFDPTTFTKNRKRLLEHHVGQALFDEVIMAADRHGLLSDEHFTVDGTLIEAAASLKSFRPRDGDPPSTTDGDSGNPSVDFRGERRSNTTHQSTTDPEARLLRKGKGKEAKLVFMAHALMENRHGMLTDFQVSSATGTAEHDAVPVLLEQARERGFHPRTLGGDKNYDTRECVAAMRERRVTPHVAQNTSGRRSAIDGRTARHRGYAVSQRIRKRVEEIFGWMKNSGKISAHTVSGVGPDRVGRVPGSDGLQPGANGQACPERSRRAAESATGGHSHPGSVTPPWRIAPSRPRRGKLGGNSFLTTRPGTLTPTQRRRAMLNRHPNLPDRAIRPYSSAAC